MIGMTNSVANADISNKMDKPTNTGNSNQILYSNGSGGSLWKDPVTAGEIGSAVTSWLDSNIPTGQTVAVDKSLSVSSAAADSLRTGEIKNIVDDTIDWHYEFANIGQGSNGLSADATRLLSSVIYINGGETVTVDSGYEYRLHATNASGDTLLYNTAYFTGTKTISNSFVLDHGHYLRILVRNANNNSALITPKEFSPHFKMDVAFPFINDTKDKIDSIYTAMPKEYTDLFENGALSAVNGLLVSDNTRISTKDFYLITEGSYFSMPKDFEFRIFRYDATRTYLEATSWKNSVTFAASSALYSPWIKITIRKQLNYANISPSDITDAIDTNILVGECAKLVAFDSINKINQFNLNVNLTGLSDMNWEYQNWVFPQSISYSRIRNRLYFTFTNAAGYSGIAQYDYNTKEVTKTFLKLNDETDDHNLVAVLMMSNNHLLCAYSGGHNSDCNIYIRKARAQESIESFEDAIVLESSYVTSYSQLFEYDGKIYLFYRNFNTNWAYRISSDFGSTWSNEIIIVHSNVQYYCQFTETTTDGILRLCCYSNPDAGDVSIRMAYLHLDNMTLYNTDNSTIIGTSEITPSQITAVIPEVSGKYYRLFNGAKTAIGDTKILYCEFTNASDGVYYIYDNGTKVEIANAGNALWEPKAQLGIAWIGTNKIAVARGYEGRDLIEIYTYSSGVVTLDKKIADNARGNIGIRTARPMVDNNQKSIIYLKGYYNPASFKDATMDAYIYNIETE